MPNESQDEQIQSEATSAETPPNETLAQRLKRLSISGDPSGRKFVDVLNLGPIVFHHLGSFEPPEDPSSK